MRKEQFEELLRNHEFVIEEIIEKHNPCYMGEVYNKIRSNFWGSYWKWTKFKTEDMKDSVDGYAKILGEWHAKKDIIIYKDRYEKKKKEIEKKIKR